MHGRRTRLAVTFLLVALALTLLPVTTQAGPWADVSAPAPLGTQYLPMVYKQRVLSERLGFGALSFPITYPELAGMKAGWYVDWTVHGEPARPNNMDFAQTVRVHQTLTCARGSADAHDRTLCPYATPLSYETFPSWDIIKSVVQKNKGSMWLIGNEMDRRDWPGGGQDEILPETYAVAYHDLYFGIKQVDPRARIVIGGVIQATPLRLEYLTKVWNAYQARYGTSMPVDVWNVHNFILREASTGHGAGIPPGSDATSGMLYADNAHVDMAVFDKQIRDFRQWMKDRGQQNKPLIVSEYGVLYYHIPEVDTAVEVKNFMLATFNYFLNTKDCTLGLPVDGCRLVQRWAWYSLDDPGVDFNRFGALFDRASKQITTTGTAFRDFSLAHINELAVYW